MSISLARTKRLVKLVLQTMGIAVCVLLDSRVMNAKMVRANTSAAMYYFVYPARQQAHFVRQGDEWLIVSVRIKRNR